MEKCVILPSLLPSLNDTILHTISILNKLFGLGDHVDRLTFPLHLMSTSFYALFLRLSNFVCVSFSHIFSAGVDTELSAGGANFWCTKHAE